MRWLRLLRIDGWLCVAWCLLLWPWIDRRCWKWTWRQQRGIHNLLCLCGKGGSLSASLRDEKEEDAADGKQYQETASGQIQWRVTVKRRLHFWLASSLWRKDG